MEPRRGWTTFWQVAAGFCVLGAVEALWIFLAHAWNVPASATGLLGGIMGAIFTAGGIVVAMVSLYSLSSVARTAHEAVREAVAEEEAQFDARVQRQIMAYDLFAEAKHRRRLQQFAAGAAIALRKVTTKTFSWMHEYSLVGDAHLWLDGGVLESLNEAEGLVQNAVAAGTVAGSKTWLALEFFHTVVREFIRHQEASPGIASAPPPAASRLHHAVRWLEAAQTDVSGDFSINALLADLYGIMSDWPAMLSSLRAALIEAHGWRPPRPDWSLVCLVNACGSDEAKLREVAGLLGKQFPWSADRVAALFDAERESRGALRRVWVVNRPVPGPGPLDAPLSPGLVILHPRDEGQASAMWHPVVQPGPTTRRAGIPMPAGDGTQNQDAISVMELVEQLCGRFFVIEQVP